MAYLKRSDFIGNYRISANNIELQKISEIIINAERTYLLRLFGIDIYNALLLTIDFGGQDPVPQEFVEVLNPISYIDSCGRLNYNDGLKSALAKVIYYVIHTDQIVNNSSLGDRNNTSEVSNGVNSMKTLLLYNEGVRCLRVIQKYMLDNLDKYPNYEISSHFKYMSFI